MSRATRAPRLAQKSLTRRHIATRFYFTTFPAPPFHVFHMKFRRLLTASAATLAIAATASAALVADLQAPVTISLKLTRDTEPKSRPIDGGYELSTTFASVSLTGRDFLQQLIDEGKIIGPLRGWGLVIRCTSDEADNLNHRLYAVKAGQPDYAVDTGETRALGFEQPYLTSALRLRSVGGEIVSGRDTQKFSVAGTFTAPISPMSLYGVGQTSLAVKPFSLGSNSGSVSVPSRVALDLSGGFVVEGDGDVDIYIVEGSIIYGQHRVTALRVAPSE